MMNRRALVLTAILLLLVGTVFAIVGFDHGKYSAAEQDKRNLIFAYGCGFIAGQHEIMQIVNVPGPHKPASSALCEPIAKIAAAGGFIGSKKAQP